MSAYHLRRPLILSTTTTTYIHTDTLQFKPGENREKMTTTTSAVKLLARRSQDRGHANHQWLQSYHTFSFANYHHYDFNGFSSLKVINEDRVQPSTGFPQHSHNNFEIFSYIVTGELEHKDSLGNLEIMKQGAIQMTSAGTGISHSEYNRNTTLPVHFLQVWISPAANGLKPQYYNRCVPFITSLFLIER